MGPFKPGMGDNIKRRRVRNFEDQGYSFAPNSNGQGDQIEEPVGRNKLVSDPDFYKEKTRTMN